MLKKEEKNNLECFLCLMEWNQIKRLPLLLIISLKFLIIISLDQGMLVYELHESKLCIAIFYLKINLLYSDNLKKAKYIDFRFLPGENLASLLI